jgi:hypothetical protein
MAPIDPFKQHRQLRTTQHNTAGSGMWPDKTTSLKTLGKQTQAIPIPPQNLHAIACAAAEHKKMATEGILG